MERMKFTKEQYEILFSTVRYYQVKKCSSRKTDYEECNEILNSLYDIAYLGSK